MADDERDRVITEDDVIDDADPDQRERPSRPVETAVTDIREIAATEPRQRQEDVVRVPHTDQLAAAEVLAKRSLAEIEARQVIDQDTDVDERAAELARWHDDDQAAELEDADEAPAFEDSYGG